MIDGFTREELLHEVRVAPRTGLLPLPDTRLVERPDFWQVLTPSLTRGGLNEVQCSELPEDRCDEIIAATVAEYRSLGLRFRWCIDPETRPHDLADRLARQGLTRSESSGMARSTAGLPGGSPAGVTVEEVSLANVDDFTDVMARGWESDPAALDPMHRQMLTDPASRCRLFLARHEGTPAAASAYTALDRSAYLMGAVTLSSFRGRGLYRALVAARLSHAAAGGLALATSVAMESTSAPILAALGFERVCSILSYSSD